MARPPLSSLILAAVLVAGAASGAGAAAYERRIYTTRTCGTDAPRLDGIPNEECWNLVEWASDFVQSEPTEGQPPTYQTAFKVLYDDHALYLAYRASDPEPQKIADYLARRDRFPGDWVEVNIDSHHDLRTGFSFTSSVSGTRGDEFISEDGDNWNGNWDPIWQLTTHIDAEGWTAEVMIPLSQLRFSSAEEQVWGMQVQRRLFRKEERSLWQPKSKQDSGWVSRFGELRGLRGIRPSRQVELLPYAVARGERFESIPGDPFQDGSKGDVQGGLDGKLGVTHDLTLDFTLNPDFGQVEADPSQINLTAFETRFDEKRPFFIEGANIFSYQIAPSIAGGNFTQDNLFYSRRIGRRPHGFPDLADGEYAETPQSSKIIAAFKMSGKTESGLSVGLLESVTAEEKAEIDSPTGTRDEPIEPLTNFLVGRVQRDFRKGGTRVGGMFTATNRDIPTSELEFLHSAAYSGGIDLYHSWSNKAWYTALNGVASDVEGSTDALLRTQTSSARYFQRPDNDYESVDSTRTSLQGNAGSFRLGRVTGAGWRFETGAAWRSPGFEINDVGFMQRADEVNQFSWVGWASHNPFSIFRRIGVNGNQWLNWDFGGNPTVQQANTNFNMNFKNNWAMGAGVTYTLESLSNNMLRGGPSALKPRQSFANVWVDSDQRRRVYASFGGSVGVAAEDSYDYREAWMDVSWLPQNALRITLSPFYSTENNELQYVDEQAYGADPRYLFGTLDQETFGLTARIDYTVTPNLTVQYYGAPFVSAGNYNAFKRITSPRADAYRDRFHTFGPAEIRHNAASDSLLVDENVDGTEDYRFANPDFDFRDFNSNLVVRWEFQPGSTLFVVWQQARSETVPHGTFSMHHDIGGLFDVHPHNVFLIKVNKWFSL